MFIARLLISLLIAFITLSGTILYTFNQTKVYQAGGTLQLFIKNPYRIDALVITHPKDDDNPSEEAIRDYNTQIRILESERLLKGVEQRLSEEELERFMLPYKSDLTPYIRPIEILANNRTITSDRSWMVHVHFKHPSPDMAARIANLFMEEYINYVVSVDIDFAMGVVEGLRIKQDQQRERVAELVKKVATLQHDTQKDPSALELAALELGTQKAFLEDLTTRLTTIKASIGLTEARGRILDYAFPPMQHHSPNILGNLRSGALTSLGLGLGFFLLSGLVFRKR
ncbi:MAG: hypothetical protein ACPGJU_03885 [Coraliomargarita sp.]